MADEVQQEGGLGGVEVKGMKTPFGGTYAGNVVTAASPELLKNMQDMIDQRTGGFNSFLEGLKDAVAVTSRDPGSAMAARDQEKRLSQQSIFEMKQQMAMMKQQEKQAALQQANLEKQLAGFGLYVPGISGEAGTRPGGGGNLDMNILQRVYDLGRAGHGEAAEKMLNTHLLDVGKARATNMGQKDYFSPTIQIQDSSVPGGTRMVSAAEINADPSLLPTAFGKKTLDNMQQQPTGATTTTPGGALGDVMAVQKGLFGQESSSGKADTSVKNEQGVLGPMQIKDTTFKMYQDQGIIPKHLNFEDPVDNKMAGDILAHHFYKKNGNDINKAFAEYYGGAGAINKDGSINVDRKNPERPNDPTIGEYINQARQKGGLPPVSIEDLKKPSATPVGGTTTTTATTTAQPGVRKAGLTPEQVSQPEIEKQATIEANKSFIGKTREPLADKIEAERDSIIEAKNVIEALKTGKYGPGSGIDQVGKQIAQVLGLPLNPKEYEQYLNNLTIEKARQVFKATGARAAMGAQFTENESNNFLKTLASINDPKEYIKAVYQLKIATAEARQARLDNMDANPKNMAAADRKWRESGAGDKFLRQVDAYKSNTGTVVPRSETGRPKAEAKTVARTGVVNDPSSPKNGMKVIEYTDGTREYK
jgi:hypothetical protein